MCPEPRYATGVDPNGPPDMSRATICNKGRSKWPSRCVPSHDMRQGRIQMALQMCPEPRYVPGAHANGLPDVSRATICGRGASKWLSRCVPSHNVRQGRIQMAFQMCQTRESRRTGAAGQQAGAAGQQAPDPQWRQLYGILLLPLIEPYRQSY